MTGAPDAWGDRWAGLLDALGAAAARRVQRGQGLVRRGAVRDVQVSPGRIDGQVVEDRHEPARVRIVWTPPPDAAWEQAMATLRGELRYTATLLEGRLDAEVEAALASAGIRMVPVPGEIEWRCSAEERDRPCRHAAAVYLAAGLQLDREPGHRLRLRGRELDQLVRELRDEAAPDLSSVPGLDDVGELTRARGDLDGVALHPSPVDDPAGLFRHLGPPPGVDDDAAFGAIIERAAATAWRLAAGDGTVAAEEELLLAQLRAQRMATAATLALALGRSPDEVRSELDRLFERGAVLRTGTGDATRYRAAT